MRTHVKTIASGLLGKSRISQAAWVAALILTALLLTLPEMIRLDGKSHSDWLQFLGRFHPLAIHLPIGLIVLVPVLELAGTFRPALRASIP